MISLKRRKWLRRWFNNHDAELLFWIVLSFFAGVSLALFERW